MTRARTGVNGGEHPPALCSCIDGGRNAPVEGCEHCGGHGGRGTFIPARLACLAPGLEAQALRETAARLLRHADQLDGRRSRVTFLVASGGECGLCQGYFEGDRCPDCALLGGGVGA